MALFKIKDLYPDYKDRFFDGNDVKSVDVYARSGDEKVGNIDNVLVDESGRIRYLVLNTGSWFSGKNVLLPIGRCVDDPNRNRIYATDLTKQQVENLPEYSDDLLVDHSYEERVRTVYRAPSAEMSAPVEISVPVEQAGMKGYVVSQPAAMPVSKPPAQVPTPVSQPTAEPEPDVYDREPDLYAMNDQDHRRLRLYEERLVASKHREKTGEVRVSKRIETEQAEASVPVQKEKIVIEIESVAGATRVSAPEGSFQDGEVTHMDVYEEQANIRKEPVVRQEVNIRKEVEQDVVTARETLRHEELDVRQEGSPDVIDRTR
ncbi:MAG: DUF2382 domain-containing protein [Leptolyngbyaceae cyanobacterium SM1_1_3]|nr:DUF2382 domain-containing protein [Leptolyngbyaceae cyanobacterium SM1_1_3]NJM84933.1 DUF2382 domain-containing protein [Leptolyngbyaceae cyanobacterium RM2_2_21]NJO10445.1 DUF2382 domain-containing protein [Leptolyngbyaceae cyanobacterium SL_1_1]